MSKLRFDGFDLLLVLGLLGLFLLLAASSLRPAKFGDQLIHTDAKRLAAVFRGAASWREATFTLAPGPVLYYAIPYAAVRPGSPDEAYWRAGFVFTIFAMAAALLILRRAGALAGGEAAGRAAAAMALLLPFAVYYSYGNSAEPLSYIGACVLGYGWARNRSGHAAGARGRWPTVPVMCAGLLLLLLARPTAILVIPLMLASAFVLWRFRATMESRREAVNISYAALAAALVVAGVSLGVAALPRNRIVSSQHDNFYQTVFQGCFQFRKEPFDWRHWTKDVRVGSVDYADWLRTREALLAQAASTGVPYWRLRPAWVLGDFEQHPVLHLRMSAIRLLALHVWRVNSLLPADFRFAGMGGRFWFYAFHLVVNGANCLLLGICLRFFWRNRQNLATLWMLWAPWLALAVFHSMLYVEARYLFASLPGLYLAAALALSPARAESAARRQAAGNAEAVECGRPLTSA